MEDIVGTYIDQCHILSKKRHTQLFDKNGISKGWTKVYEIECNKHHIFTRSSSYMNRLINSKSKLICPKCKDTQFKTEKKQREILYKQKQEEHFKKTSLKENRPDMEKYFLHKKDFEENSMWSNKYVDMICPFCNRIKNMRISILVSFGYSCPYCSDRRSIGERFVANILDENDIDYIFDKATEWSDRKRYDFLIKNMNTIIEVNGQQHYEETGFNLLSNKSLEQEKKNDNYKYSMAIDNGIKTYITLDFRESNYEYMMQSIKSNADFLTLISANTDFNQCYNNSISSQSSFNIVVELFNKLYSNNPNPSNFNIYIKTICKKLDLSKTTVRKILNSACEQNLCEYNGNLSSRSWKRYNAKTITCPEINKTFESLQKCADYFGCSRDVITYYLKEKNKKRKKYKNKYSFVEIVENSTLEEVVNE